MKQVFNRIFPAVELLFNRELIKQTLPVISCSVLQKRYGRLHRARRGGPPIENERLKEWTHKWYKWNYERLPTQTSLDIVNPQFSIRPPDFQLPKRKIGLSRKSWRQRLAEVAHARQDPDLEKLSRNRQLMISIDEVEAEWQEEYGFADIINLSGFYGINRDLFGNNDVHVESWLDLSFGNVKIHRGNIVTPSELLCAPTTVNFQCNEDYFSTLVLTNLDGHPLDSSKEIVHWVVGNIPGNAINEGDTIIEYLPPIPWKGTGYHRFVFALYKHRNSFTYANIGDPNTLNGRTFSSWDISSSLDMVPVSLAWCQVRWDDSVSNTCSLLKDLAGEPVFDFEEYIEPKEERKMLKIQANELKFRNM